MVRADGDYTCMTRAEAKMYGLPAAKGMAFRAAHDVAGTFRITVTNIETGQVDEQESRRVSDVMREKSIERFRDKLGLTENQTKT